MLAKEVAAKLLETPEAHVLLCVGNDWVETVAVQATGQHRNAVTITVCHPELGGGVIVVEPDIGPN